MNIITLSGVFFVFTLMVSSVFADIIVSTTSELIKAVNNTHSGGDRTILIRDGHYQLSGKYLQFVSPGVMLRSLNGKRDNVILDGAYQTTEIIRIAASDITIADITIKQARDHAIHITGGRNNHVYNTVIDNIHIIDPGEQAIKINPAGAYSVHSGIVKNSLIEMTAEGRHFVETDESNSYPCYTGGIDAHAARQWKIQDNEFRGFWCANGLSEHAVHFWSNSADTLVERNLIIDCARGIGFGLGKSGHKRGIIRNNMISNSENHAYNDVGISLESATAAEIYNNTLFQKHRYPNAIEYRFKASNRLRIVNNLTNRKITSRNGGTAVQLTHNKTHAVADWFVDAAAGDLHLRDRQNGITDAAIPFKGLVDDIDRQSRLSLMFPDVGADEFYSGDAVPR